MGIAVPLTGRLCRYGVNVPMISAIRQQWHLFAIPADELFGSFFDAMNAFECPFGNSGLPRHMHDTDKSGVDLKLVWLPAPDLHRLQDVRQRRRRDKQPL